MRRRPIRNILTFAWLTAGVAVFPLGATETVSMAQEVALSKRVALVEVVSSEAQEGEAGNIFTLTRFRALTRLKGTLPDNFTTRVIGGQIGERQINSPLLRTFVPSHQYVLFAGPDNARGFVTLSPSGVVPVLKDPKSGASVVQGPFTLPLFRKASGEPYRSVPLVIPLDDFLFSLKRLIANQHQ